MKEGIIKFHGYCVEKISYLRGDNTAKTDTHTNLSTQFLLKLAIKKDVPELYNLIIGVRIGYKNDTSPFSAEVILRGFFEIKEIKDDRDLLEGFYIANSSAILYPYLRSTLSDITSKSYHRPVILPTINFYNIIDGLDKDDLFLDSDEYEEYMIGELKGQTK